MRFVVYAAVLLLATATHAQQSPPQIRTTGAGEVTLSPDWASVTLGVTSRGATAAEASRAQARTVQAVWDAVTRAGVPRDSVKTLATTVQPVIDYEHDRQVTGYQADVSLQVPVHALDRLGTVIDAALGAGATELRGVQPRSTHEDAARVEALTQAVHAARADAETLAAAAGGRLGGLMDLSTAGPAEAMPRPEVMQMQARQGPAMPELVIRASVSANWRFLTSRSPSRPPRRPSGG